MSISSNLKRTVRPFLQTLLANYIYETRFGSVRIKRKWGTGSWNRLMQRTTGEEVFLTSLDLKGKTVYDIGGFIGLLTVAFAKATGPTGQVIVFEPNEENYSQLLENLRLNRVDNVRSLKLGIASKKSQDQVFLVRENLSATGSLDQKIQSKIIDDGHFRELHIEVDTLDNAMATHGLAKPDFIKIDIEGMEYPALLGMTEILRKYSPQLHIEIHGADQSSKRENIGRVVEFLQSQGYSIWHVETQKDIDTHNFVIAQEGHIFCRRSEFRLAHSVTVGTVSGRKVSHADHEIASLQK
ncbi:MAG TPA: FkbM family methyltransferase [Desulfomonilaceae bacterium]|nr:FkbM family methyltransferase [Desulfomonilaceae bacterium]